MHITHFFQWGVSKSRSRARMLQRLLCTLLIMSNCLFILWYQDDSLVRALTRQGQKRCLWEGQYSMGMCSDFPITPLTLTEALFLIAACFGNNLVQHSEQILLAPPPHPTKFQRQMVGRIIYMQWQGNGEEKLSDACMHTKKTNYVLCQPFCSVFHRMRSNNESGRPMH